MGTVVSGTVADGEQVTDTSGNVLPDTAIESNLSGSGAGSTWLVDFAQTVAAENMTMTGAPLSVLYTAITGATKNSGYFSIQQNGYFNWDTASLTYASGTAAAALGLTKAAGALLDTPGENITSEAAFMSMVEAEDPDFGSFQATWPQLAEEDPQAQAALAAWAASTDGQFQFLNDTSDAPPAGTSAPTIDPPGTWSGPGASLPTLAAPGTYIPNAGATSARGADIRPCRHVQRRGRQRAHSCAARRLRRDNRGEHRDAGGGGHLYLVHRGDLRRAGEFDQPGYYSLAGASAPTIGAARLLRRGNRRRAPRCLRPRAPIFRLPGRPPPRRPRSTCPASTVWRAPARLLRRSPGTMSRMPARAARRRTIPDITRRCRARRRRSRRSRRPYRAPRRGRGLLLCTLTRRFLRSGFPIQTPILQTLLPSR